MNQDISTVPHVSAVTSNPDIINNIFFRGTLVKVVMNEISSSFFLVLRGSTLIIMCTDFSDLINTSKAKGSSDKRGRSQ